MLVTTTSLQRRKRRHSPGLPSQRSSHGEAAIPSCAPPIRVNNTSTVRLLRKRQSTPMFEVLDKQSKLTVNQWSILGAAIIGDALEFFDYFLIGFVLAFIIGPWRPTFRQSAVVLLSSGIGAIVGAYGWGRIADRIGRRKVFILTVLNFSLATGTLYFTPDDDWSIHLSIAVLRRLGRRRTVLRRPPAGSRVHALDEARLDRQPRHLRHPAWLRHRRCARRLCDSSDRLARPLRGRCAAQPCLPFSCAPGSQNRRAGCCARDASRKRENLLLGRYRSIRSLFPCRWPNRSRCRRPTGSICPGIRAALRCHGLAMSGQTGV
jgi:hypothetical protein